MKVRDLDGKESIWTLTGRVVTTANDRAIRSSLHIEARHLLVKAFSTLTILEEVPIHLHRYNSIAYLDFYLPLLKMAIEVQGEQHFKFVSYFHGTPAGFLKARKLDQDKHTWCDINGVALVEFPYSETIEQWKEKLA